MTTTQLDRIEAKMDLLQRAIVHILTSDIEKATTLVDLYNAHFIKQANENICKIINEKEEQE